MALPNDNSILKSEHSTTYSAKKAILHGLTTGGALVAIKVDSNGVIQTSGGSASSLAAILAVGNSTGGTNLVITAGDQIASSDATGVVIDNITISDESTTNLIQITNGTADIQIDQSTFAMSGSSEVTISGGAVIDISSDLTVSGASAIDQDVSIAATPTFAGVISDVGSSDTAGIYLDSNGVDANAIEFAGSYATTNSGGQNYATITSTAGSWVSVAASDDGSLGTYGGAVSVASKANSGGYGVQLITAPGGYSDTTDTPDIQILTGNQSGGVSGDSGNISLQTGTSTSGTRGSVTVDANTFIINSTTAVDGIIDDDSMATASATTLATSESIKAYVDASGGGGGATGYDATVGSGGDYADIQAAITGVGGTNIKLLLISNVTEDSNIAVPSGAELVIDLSSYTLTMASYKFTYTGVANVYIRGNGVDSGAELDWTPTSAIYLFDNNSYDESILDMEGLVFDNNTGTSSTMLHRGVYRLRNVKATLSNARYGFVYAKNGLSNPHVFSDITIEGGGSSCYNAFYGIAHNMTINNLTLQGSFHATADTIESRGVMNNVVIDTATNVYIVNTTFGTLNNVQDISANATTIENGVGAKLSNAYIPDGTVTMPGANEKASISGVTAATLTPSTGDYFTVTNSQFSNAITLGSGNDNIKFTNVRFLGGVTVQSGSDDHGFMNCQFGVDGGGGALKLTIQSGANRIRAIGCMTDADISDSGTDSELFGNSTY